jgi:small GTP-binding protein
MLYDFLFKIIIVGEPGVGKSTIIARLNSMMVNTSYVPTIGIDFAVCTNTIFEPAEGGGDIECKTIKTQIWDTAGQEYFRSIIQRYYHDIAGAILVYDISNYETFERIEKWIEDLERFKNSIEMPGMILIGNKNDCKREVKFEEAKDFADKNGMLFSETSALDNDNVDVFFQDFIEYIYKRKDTFTHGIKVFKKNERIVFKDEKPITKCCVII